MQIENMSIIPLGGLGEFGMNTMIYECENDIIVIDTGIMFPDEATPGIDLITADLSYLIENQDKVRAIIITHAHEDHMGGLSFFLRQINVPVYGTELTLELAKGRLKEYKILNSADLNPISTDDKLSIGCFDLEFVHVTHSIPSAVSVVLHTPVGTIVHTSDFKFDHTPVDGKPSEIHKLTELGENGVLLLLSDSTNSNRSGYTPSELSIRHELNSIFKDCDRRLFACTFSSSLHRLQQFIDLAVEHHRLIAIAGRSMINNVRIAGELGYLDVPHKLLIDAREVHKFQPHEVMVLCTGSQGEPRSAMALMSRGDHSTLRIEEGDTVILSARKIPGNERAIANLISHILRRGASVIDEQMRNVHVSGHASREDLKLMLNLVKPKFFIPLHGAYSQLAYHAEIAEMTGISRENITIAENGDRVSLSDDYCFVNGMVQSGRVFVDGKIEMDEDIVLRDRRHLADDGMVIPIIVLDKSSGEISGGPDIVSRGFVHMDESEDLINEAKIIVIEAIDEMSHEVKSEIDLVQDEIRAILRRFFKNKAAMSPMILPVVMQI